MQEGYFSQTILKNKYEETGYNLNCLTKLIEYLAYAASRAKI